MMQVRSTHPYSFRSGQWADVVADDEVRGRSCWLVVFVDGVTDLWVRDDPDNVLELREVAA